MADEAEKPRTYGSRAHVKKQDPARCVEAVWNNAGWYHHQCPNKRGKGPGGLYCGTHDPERIAVKNAERAAKYKAKMDQHPLAVARRENEKLRAALEPFARFAEMFEEARALQVGQVPTEPEAEWYVRDTRGGTYVLRVGMFYDAKAALQK